MCLEAQAREELFGVIDDTIAVATGILHDQHAIEIEIQRRPVHGGRWNRCEARPQGLPEGNGFRTAPESGGDQRSCGSKEGGFDGVLGMGRSPSGNLAYPNPSPIGPGATGSINGYSCVTI
jgi:hypothetical protein